MMMMWIQVIIFLMVVGERLAGLSESAPRRDVVQQAVFWRAIWRIGPLCRDSVPDRFHFARHNAGA